jgi:hypothetical protein
MRSQSRPTAALVVLLLAAIPVAANFLIIGMPTFGQTRRPPSSRQSIAIAPRVLAGITPAQAHSVPAGVAPGLTPGLSPELASTMAAGQPRPGARRAISVGSPGVWARLRACESGGNYAANTGNGYYGAYQFALGTWRSLGYGGYPHHAAPAVQDEAARRLQARSGWRQWPACARRLGLR